MSERAKVGLLSLGVGLAAAGVGAAVGLAAERVTVGRPLLPAQFGRNRGEADPEPYGELRGAAQIVVADDGTELYVEVDEPIEAPARTKGRPLTLVLSHGYALTMDSWHFQRKALRGSYRLVFWDQRGHGRSGSGPDGSATIDQIGRDLEVVLQAVAPTGPLILLGHSMGGMTIMSLAERRPDLFSERVLGVGFVATSAGDLGTVDFGLTGIGRLVQRLGPGTVRALSRTPKLVERGRRIGIDLEMVVVRRYSYASPVSQALVRFTAEMIASTRLEVISSFLPIFSMHDKREALAALHGVEVLVMVGDQDLLTPPDHSEDIVRQLPGAEHVVVRDGGHLLMLEHPEAVNGHLTDLITRAQRAQRAQGRGEGPVRRAAKVRRAVGPLRRRHAS